MQMAGACRILATYNALAAFLQILHQHTTNMRNNIPRILLSMLGFLQCFLNVAPNTKHLDSHQKSHLVTATSPHVGPTAYLDVLHAGWV
jgi:hypothetical protein